MFVRDGSSVVVVAESAPIRPRGLLHWPSERIINALVAAKKKNALMPPSIYQRSFSFFAGQKKKKNSSRCGWATSAETRQKKTPAATNWHQCRWSTFFFYNAVDTQTRFENCMYNHLSGGIEVVVGGEKKKMISIARRCRHRHESVIIPDVIIKI